MPALCSLWPDCCINLGKSDVFIQNNLEPHGVRVYKCTGYCLCCKSLELSLLSGLMRALLGNASIQLGHISVFSHTRISSKAERQKKIMLLHCQITFAIHWLSLILGIEYSFFIFKQSNLLALAKRDENSGWFEHPPPPFLAICQPPRLFPLLFAQFALGSTLTFFHHPCLFYIFLAGSSRMSLWMLVQNRKFDISCWLLVLIFFLLARLFPQGITFSLGLSNHTLLVCHRLYINLPAR
ncbi:hypothetical protein BX661DRAFT_61624 [Kickxella alabastrina]|uniref:uncharacterized protein n=1 Tax=Kickxella alabastrina TaxID=61397 RepID=UPI00221F1995|nr:uncharacterized protein BX661DRAFT_61624 [Kickxella alabastrina]KAI7822110.1 hypothetical protein BX661DRAFT_61624 [Kickxella alabastrina]